MDVMEEKRTRTCSEKEASQSFQIRSVLASQCGSFVHATSLLEVFMERAAKEPDRVHLYLQENQKNTKTISYGMLFDEAQKVATGLLALGVKKNDTIGIMLPTCEDFFSVFLGILLTGAIPVPLYPPARPERIEEYATRAVNILRDAQIKWLVVFQKVEHLSRLFKTFLGGKIGIVTPTELKKATGSMSYSKISPNANVLIQYTSGSTNLPKGVLISNDGILANIRAIGKAAQITSTDVAVSWLPLYHDMGLIGCWLTSLYHGNPIVILSPLAFLLRPERWLWAIHNYRATLSAAPNFAYELCVRRVLDTAIINLDLSTWRLSFNGAEGINRRTVERFTTKFAPYGFKPQTMFPVYGLAETCVALTFPELNQLPSFDTVDKSLLEKEGRAKRINSDCVLHSNKVMQFVCCGKPLPGHYIRVVDESNKLLPERTVGNLQFKGPSSMQGYFQQPKATAAIFHQGWWETGDLAYISNGQLYITGRKKDVIIKAGRNIYPEEIEEVSALVKGVRRGCVAAFGVMDTKRGTEKIVIVAETRETKMALKENLAAQIQKKVVNVLGIMPDHILLVEPHSVPKTSSGKLQRSRCKQLYIEDRKGFHKKAIFTQILRLYCKAFFLRVQRILTGDKA